VDPIDGTASFAGGYDGFVTQVALMEGHKPRYAAIYAPALDALYTAEKGRGAYLNSRRLEIPDPERWETLIDNYAVPRGIARSALDDLRLLRYIECGSISLKICKVADGTADIFFKAVPVKDWDIAPPHLVLGEAGGILRDLEGRDIAYGQRMEYPGIVAAKSIAHATRITFWYSERRERGSGQ
jgi:fructose-1,6-bisphosphatase/inositol monophosphatase family enzyme